MERTGTLPQNQQTEQAMSYIGLVRQINEERERRTGKAAVCFTHHYGCQQNVSDGEKIDGMLAEMGYTAGASPEGADIVLFNTCAVRENAEDRIFGNVGALKHEKRRNPDLIIGLCGCMVQQPHIADKLKKSFPYVDLVFGTHALPRLPELLYHKLTEGGRIFETADSDGEIVEDLPLRRDGSVKAWLPIMYGCDNFCTYCVVPLVRGRERSRNPERVVAEARELIAGGYREITLLGQNVNSYGKKFARRPDDTGVPDGAVNFAELLRRLCAIPGDYRIRFMTSHPKDCTRELIDVIAEHPQLCSHIHLPVQSGSDRVLAAMNRGYSAADYLDLIAYAKARIPGVSFTSDILVGFPGETEADFAATLDLVERVGYHALFTFLYSKRQGTRAAAMDDPTPPQVKSERFQRLLALQQRIGIAKHEALVGKIVRVLAEGPGKTGEGYLTGRTESNIIADFAAPVDRVGQFVDIKVTKALNWAILGEAVETASPAPCDKNKRHKE